MSSDKQGQLGFLEMRAAAPEPRTAPKPKRRRRSGRSVERDKQAKAKGPGVIYCRHFTMCVDDETGARRPGCALGINVRELVGGDDFGWRKREPCVTTRLSEEQVSCDSYEMDGT